MDATAGDAAAFDAVLAALTPDAVTELREALDAVEAAGPPYAHWPRHEPDERGVIQMPYPLYTPAVDRLRSAAGRLVVVFEWPAWAGYSAYDAPEALAAAPVHDALRMITRTLRGERFVDGALEGELDAGRFQAAVRRVLDVLASDARPTRD